MWIFFFFAFSTGEAKLRTNIQVYANATWNELEKFAMISLKCQCSASISLMHLKTDNVKSALMSLKDAKMICQSIIC